MGRHLRLLSVAVVKLLIRGGRGFLELIGCSPSLREVRTRTRKQEPWGNTAGSLAG